MKKRVGASLTILLLILALVWALRSQTETHVLSSQAPAENGGSAPVPAQPQSQSETSSAPQAHSAAAAPAESAMAGRAAALAAFERKRQAAGMEGSQTLPPPMSAFDGLPLSPKRRINQRPYHILGARAVPRDQYQASMGQILFEHNGFAVVGLASTATEAWREMVLRENDRPVVVNPSNGRLAVVTGTLIVKLRDMSAAEQLAALEKLEILSKDESIRTVFFRAPPNYLLLAGQTRLLEHPDVERVELELYQARKEPR